MKFALITLAVALLMTSEVQTVTIQQKAYQVDENVLKSHQEIFSQLHSKAQAKGFFDFLKKAGDWIKGAVDTVSGHITKLFKGAQVHSRAYVNELAQ